MDIDTRLRTPSAGPAARPDRSRSCSVLVAVLFAPAALAAGALTLTSERAARCLTYGEGCSPALPDQLFPWSLGLAATACLVALAAPVAQLRRGALAVQVVAECTALLAILSHA
ncbi:hypothetical protein [Streptomyces sp. NPDC056600]|uniref:hypothetical protein n=1 Tax=Streptomyces sp. NPDC056600 TaxID=3345874 RepID=UPI0036B42391